jgi:hypothetical protein
MKELKIILVVLLIILPIFAIYRWTESQIPEWNQQARIATEIQQAVAPTVARQEIERAELWTVFYQALMVAIIVGLFVAIGVLGWKQYDQRRESWARMVDGGFALQSFSNGSVRWQIDPNKQLTGTTGFQVATGLLGEFSRAAGPDRQLVNNLAIQKTRTAAASVGADGVRNSAQAKLAAGYYDRNELPQLPMADEEAPDPVATWQVLTAQDAFAQSDSNRWVLGQSPTTGALFELNPKEAAHYGIVGATGTGKTAYTALLLMANALKNRFRVVILDGKGGADWSKYQHVAEYTALDYSNVGGIVSQMLSEYDKRQAILNQHGVNSIWELPSGVTKPRPTLFIIDEFGAVMDSLKAANKNAYKAVELDLGNLLRLSRGAGLYVVLCDQNPSKWPGTVRANLPMNLAYRLGGGIGNAVQEYNLDRLERVGQFQVSNEVYNAFPTYEVIDQLLPDGTYKKPLALLTINSTIANRGKGTGQNDSDSTPQRNSTIAANTPVSDSTINSAGDSGNSDDSTINSAPLTGKPLSRKEIELVRNTFALTNRSRKKTVEILYGKWTVSRDSWVKDIVSGEVLQ